MKIKSWLLYKILAEVVTTDINIFKQISFCIRKIVWLTKEHFCDKALGIETCGTCFFKDDPSSYKDGQVYQPTSYPRLEKMIDYLKLTPEDVFVDLGCGKGRVIFLMATQRLRNVIGIELRKELAGLAKANLKSLKLNKTPVEIFNADACDFDVKDGTIFFMFNPFGDKTLGRIIENIKQSLGTNPRKIGIVYYNPAHRRLLESQDWLEPEGEIDKTGIFAWHNKLG